MNDANLALLLDLDGTLLPFAPTPEAATLDPGAIQLLDALCRAAVHVVIVSGRPRALLAPMRELAPHAWWIAEHGTWRCDGSGEWRGPSPDPEVSQLTAVLDSFSRIPGARLEAKSLSLSLHWRLVPRALRDQTIRDAALVCDEWLASHCDFERVVGVEMMEVRRRAANKGTAVEWLRGRMVNLDDAYCDEVRRFLFDNAIAWLTHYHVDGFRLDAVHAMIDTGATHILARVEVVLAGRAGHTRRARSRRRRRSRVT